MPSPVLPASKVAPLTEALACPHCAAIVVVPAERCFAGAQIPCTACGRPSVLECEWLGHGSHYRWELIEDGDDDEP